MRNDALRHLYVGAGLSLLLRIMGTGVMFLALLLLARALTADQFGLYVYMVDLIALFAPVATLGLGQICVRVVSDAISEGRPGALRAYRRAALGFIIVTALLFWTMLEGARHFGLMPDGMHGWLLPLSVVLLVAISVLRVAQEMLRAAKHIGLSQVVEQVIWPVGLAGLAACALLGLVALPITAIVSSQIFLMSVAAVLLFLAFRRLVLQRIPDKKQQPRERQLREWLAIGIPLAMAGLLSLIQYRGDIIALGAFAEQSELGPYAAAVRLSGLIIFALGATAAATEPLMRQYHVAGEQKNLQLVVDRGATISALLSLPAAVPFMLFPAFFLSFFGVEFTSAASALSILALGQLVNAMTGPISPLIIALGLQRANLVVMAVVATGLMISLVLAVPNYGVIGAASVTATSAVVLNCALARIIYVRSGIKTYFRPSSLSAVLADLRTRLQKMRNGNGI
ncbi:MAG: oligosaccharide flippase family protein [Sphingorhabdus sp.]